MKQYNYCASMIVKNHTITRKGKIKAKTIEQAGIELRARFARSFIAVWEG